MSMSTRIAAKEIKVGDALVWTYAITGKAVVVAVEVDELVRLQIEYDVRPELLRGPHCVEWILLGRDHWINCWVRPTETYRSDAAGHDHLLTHTTVVKRIDGDLYEGYVYLGHEVVWRHSDKVTGYADIQDFASYTFKMYARRLREVLQPDFDWKD